MVELVKPVPTDVMCDPAGGTCGYPVAVGEYLRENHKEIFTDNKLRKHFHEKLFNAFDFGSTMLRIGSMNMLLHGVEKPNVVYRDSLAQEHGGEEERYSLVLANPPFAGSLDFESCAKDLLQVVKTKKTELLFRALIMRLLKPGGRAAVIVPDGVLFGSSTAHKTLRKMIVEEQKLDGIISMPGGVFKPYAGVSTAILLFTKTKSGGTDHVWFYDMQADGKSLDDKRTGLLPPEKQGPKRDICYFLRQPDIVALANSRASGANLPRLSPTALSEISLPVPPLSEQKRIAEFLDRAEALRAKRRAALALLDELTQSIFLDMFGDPVTNPKGWDMGNIKDLLESASYGTSEKSEAVGEFPVLRVNNIS